MVHQGMQDNNNPSVLKLGYHRTAGAVPWLTGSPGGKEGNWDSRSHVNKADICVASMLC